MSRFWAESDRALRDYRNARFEAIEAKRLVDSAAVDIAEQVMETGAAAPDALAVYKKAKELAEQKSAVMEKVWEIYDRAYQIMTGQEKEKPPAGATAEGIENRAGGSLREEIDRLGAVFEVRDIQSGRFHSGKHELEDMVLGRDDLIQDADFVSEGVVGEFFQGNSQLGFQELVKLHNSSLSVDGASKDTVGGTSESTERGLTPDVPEMKEHPAAATAGCDETKNQR
ncbi:hypothetical protein RN04_03420 [Arthrobacter sp. W1]|nr:hypothetical protein RN04_03420 [Arthrobacter sp. W1]